MNHRPPGPEPVIETSSYWLVWFVLCQICRFRLIASRRYLEINASFCCMCRLIEHLHLRYFRPLCAELCLVRLPHRSLGPGIPDPPSGACGHGECLRGSLVGAGQKATTGTNLARVINSSRLMARPASFTSFVQVSSLQASSAWLHPSFGQP